MGRHFSANKWNGLLYSDRVLKLRWDSTEFDRKIAMGEKRQITSESYLRLMLILFGGMMMSQVSMVAVCIYLAVTGELYPEPDLIPLLPYVVPTVACLGFGLAFVLPAKLIAKAAEKSMFAEKLRGYQTAMIIKLALLELPSVAGCIAFCFTGDYYWCAVNLVALLFFATSFPTKQKVIDGLRLSGDEVRLLNDPKANIMEIEIDED